MCDERGWGGHNSSRWRHASRLTCFVAAATHAVSQSHLTSIQVQFETRARLSLDCCGLGLVTGWQMPQITPKSLKNEIRLPWKHGRHSICDSLVCRGTSTQIWPHFLANLTVSAKRRKAPYRRSHRDTCSQCAHRRVESEEWGFFFFFLARGDHLLTWCARKESRVRFSRELRGVRPQRNVFTPISGLESHPILISRWSDFHLGTSRHRVEFLCRHGAHRTGPSARPALASGGA